MKRLIALLFAAILTLGAVVPSAKGVAVFISAGDRPYYVHGPYYNVGPTRYVWVPGHWAWRHHHTMRVWVHGYYVVG